MTSSRPTEMHRNEVGTKGRPKQVRVTYRKMKFAFEANGFDARWHGGSAFISYFWSALSMSFPAGEEFFMNSAREVRSRMADPRQVAELAEFVRQEAHHSFQHRKFNRMFGALGFDVARYENRYARALERAAVSLRPMQKLAVTVALEHFTACLAHEFLSNPVISRGADPGVCALWSWHAAEEVEHKSTCFDVYEELGGSHRMRVVAAQSAWVLILSITLQNVASMLREDGLPLDVRDILRGIAYLVGPRGLLTRMLPSLIAYCGPGFHPWQKDDANCIDDWERANVNFIQNSQTDGTSFRGANVADSLAQCTQ